MSKRQDKFKRRPRDLYETPKAAFLPLVPHLPESRTAIDEPCAGPGRLVHHLIEAGHGPIVASDIEGTSIDALSLTECRGKMFVTNPPWSW